MAVTLLEAAKRMTGDDIRRAVIELYAENNDILRVLPFDNIEGNALKYNQEQTLPGIGFRGINEGYTESTGVLNPVTEELVIVGGDLDVDNFLTDTMGEDQRSSQEAMKVKSLAHNFGHKVIKGDSDTDPKEVDGLQKRITGTQLLDAGNGSGGDPLSLLILDTLIDLVDEPTHLLMSKAMRRRLTQAARDTTVGGDIRWELDEFGRQVAVYNGLPILIADRNSDLFATLGFNEAAPGGGPNTATSIYCLSVREGMFQGIQNGDMSVRDLGELQTKPSARTRVEWYAGIVIWNPRSVARLRGVSDAAVTT